jgi:hypothetical protein
VRRSLLWALAACGTASVAVVLWDSTGDHAVSVIGAKTVGIADRGCPLSGEQSGMHCTGVTTQNIPNALVSLPSELPERDVEAGRRDIFIALATPPPPAPPPAPPPPPPPPPPAPEAPPVNWHATGAMTTPQGERLVWLAKGNDEISVKPGTLLSDGYMVQSIDDETVVLLYPPIGTTARIPLPQASSKP